MAAAKPHIQWKDPRSLDRKQSRPAGHQVQWVAMVARRVLDAEGLPASRRISELSAYALRVSIGERMRVAEPVLIRILHTMRAAGGQPLADSDWQALLATERADFAVSDDKPDVVGWHHSCCVWRIISIAALMAARESARIAQQTLFCTRAVVVPLNLQAPSGTDTQKPYHILCK